MKKTNQLILFAGTLFILFTAASGCRHRNLPVTGIKLNPPKLFMFQGETKQITASVEPENASDKKITWISTNESIVTVDGEGNVTAHNSGTADIEAFSADGGVKAVCEIKVDQTKINGISFSMIKIPAGTGIELGDNLNTDSQKRTVDLSAFMIGETEVTQALYYEVMGENPSYFNGIPVLPLEEDRATPAGEEQTNRPVDSITWYDAVVFCNELTKKVFSEEACVYYSDTAMTQIYKAGDATKKQQKPIYANWSKKGFRLPTEAEWEYAAKGGKNTRWAGTDDPEKLKDYAWYREGGSQRRTHEVRLLTQNNYGLYDMTGNVDEWCWDWYVKDKTPEGGVNPKGDEKGKSRATRGGNFISDTESLQTISERWGWHPINNRHEFMGMRLARNL